MIFKKIKDIDLNNLEDFKDKIFITFDVDWCSDEILNYTLNIIEKYDVKSTFFITHRTSILSRMRSDQNIELGIHPNFNPLLNGDFKYGKNTDDVINYFKNIVPESLSIRSHSLTQNSYILDNLEKFGLKYDCNNFIPFSLNNQNKPYKHWTNNLIRVPHFWEDGICIKYKWGYDLEKYLKYKGIKVFDFHPIHIFLNTEDLSRYEKTRNFHLNFEKLNKFRNKNYGTENFLIDLLKTKKE